MEAVIQSASAVLRRVGIAIAASGLALGIGASIARADGKAELLITGARVLTLDARGQIASAVAVADGRVLYVGDEAGAKAFAGPETVREDLGGATLLPGLGDAHVHPSWGEFLLHRLCNVQSYDNETGLRKLADCARSAPPGDWVVAYGWYMTDNPKLSEVSLADLDAIAPDRHLVVISRDHHTFWMNSKTLAMLGVTRETPDPPGGSYGRRADGELDGTARDAANRKLTAMIQRESPYAVDTVTLYAKALRHLNSLGITSVVDALADDEAQAAYHALDRRGELGMAVSIGFAVTPGNYREEIPRIAAKRAAQTPHTRVDYVKVFADGNLEDGLAFMLGEDGKPDPKTQGYFTQAQMNEVVVLAEQHGLSVFVHTIGDAAARQALDAIATARKAGPCASCRHTITHMQWIHADDLPRFAALGVVANIQEGWIAPRAFGGPPGYDYARWLANTPAGPALAARMFPYRSLHAAGARLAASSDWFFTEENPWRTMAMGASSRDVDAPAAAPMLPGQTLDIATLLEARTAGAAFQLQDPARGVIAV
ncbi:MAG: amidohydrolase, partial [Gammaproteobacteria bacterium]